MNCSRQSNTTQDERASRLSAPKPGLASPQSASQGFAFNRHATTWTAEEYDDLDDDDSLMVWPGFAPVLSATVIFALWMLVIWMWLV